MQWTKRRAQTAADAAALAAVAERWRGSTAGESDAAALADSAKNGFTDGVSDTDVTITSNGAGGVNEVVTALVVRVVPTYFMQVLGRETVTVAAKAAAGIGNGSGCVYALNPTAPNSFLMNGGSSMNLNCGIVVSSSAGTNAFQYNGGATLNTNGNTIGVVGGANDPSGALSGQIVHIANPGDPLAYKTAPSADGMTTQTFPTSSPYTLDPGIYCGNMQFSGGNTYTLNPGIYVVAGGRMTVQSGAVVNGPGGVTFIFSNAPLYGCPGNPNRLGGIDVNSGAQMNLVAPTSGPYADILFFEDTRVTSNSQNTNTFNGGTGVVLDGGMYFPQSKLVLNGNMSEANLSFFIADQITINGNVPVNSTFTGNVADSPFKSVRLTE